MASNCLSVVAATAKAYWKTVRCSNGHEGLPRRTHNTTIPPLRAVSSPVCAAGSRTVNHPPVKENVLLKAEFSTIDI